MSCSLVGALSLMTFMATDAVVYLAHSQGVAFLHLFDNSVLLIFVQKSLQAVLSSLKCKDVNLVLWISLQLGNQTLAA